MRSIYYKETIGQLSFHLNLSEGAKSLLLLCDNIYIDNELKLIDIELPKQYICSLIFKRELESVIKDLLEVPDFKVKFSLIQK